MTEDFVFNGFWWLPNDPSVKVAGIINYSVERGIILELIGHFKPDSNGKFPGDEASIVINGCATNDKFFTLIDCNISKFEFCNKTQVASYYCGSLMIGHECFSNDKELQFKRVIVSIQHLNDWMHLNSGFHVENQFGQSDYKIEYRRPSPLLVKIRPNCELTLFPCVSFPIIITDNKATIEQNIYLEIAQKKLVNYKTLMSKVHCFKLLLFLLIQRNPALLKITFYKSNKPTISDGFEYYYWQVFHDRTEKMSFQKMFLNYASLEAEFVSLTTNWFNTFSKMENVYITLLHSYDNTLNLCDEYLNICRAIEAFGRQCEAPKVKISKSNRSRSQVVKSIVYLYDQYRDSMDQILSINYIQRFARKVTKYRNDLTHANPIISKQDKDFAKVVSIVEQLKAFLTIAVLRYQGLSSKTINQGLKGSCFAFLRLKKEEKGMVKTLP